MEGRCLKHKKTKMENKVKRIDTKREVNERMTKKRGRNVRRTVVKYSRQSLRPTSIIRIEICCVFKFTHTQKN